MMFYVQVGVGVRILQSVITYAVAEDELFPRCRLHSIYQSIGLDLHVHSFPFTYHFIERG